MNNQKLEHNIAHNIDHPSELIVTSDVDWASDACIWATQRFFESLEVKPLYFVTHPSKALDEIFRQDRAYFGIHPNFLPRSDHGADFEEVYGYFDQFPAEWRTSFRSHRFFDVTDINVMAAAQSMKHDSNQFNFMHKTRPFYHFNGLLRFPSCWEDGTQLRTFGLNNSNIVIDMLSRPGIATIGTHPLHIALNSPSFDYNRRLKDSLDKEQMRVMDGDFLASYRNTDVGIAMFLKKVITVIKDRGTTFSTFRDYERRIVNPAQL